MKRSSSRIQFDWLQKQHFNSFYDFSDKHLEWFIHLNAQSNFDNILVNFIRSIYSNHSLNNMLDVKHLHMKQLLNLLMVAGF